MVVTRRVVAWDVAAAVLLFAASLVYVAGQWPHGMAGYDEGQFLHAAKRLLDGEVMYRDVFDLETPLAFFAMAGIFAIFGVSITTARVTLGVLHGGIAVVVYRVARLLGASPAVALLAGGFSLGVAFPTVPYLSAHWWATAGSALLLLVVIEKPVRRPAHAALIGLLAGLLILIQHQKGVPMAAAVGVLLCADAWFGPGRGGDRPARLLARLVAAYAISTAAAVAATLVPLAVVAGWESIWEALVLVPLVNYRHMVRGAGWQLLLPVTVPSVPLLINGLPLLLPIPLALVLRRWWRGESYATLRPAFVAVVFAAGAIASVLYLPDYAHLGLVAPIWFCPLAGLLAAALVRCERLAYGAALRRLAVLALFVLLGWQMRRGLAYERARFPVIRPTEFGEIAFFSAEQADDVEWIRAQLDRAGSTVAFIYPYAPHLYLLTGASNPTRYEILVPGYNDARQFAEAIADLEEGRVPIVVRAPSAWGGSPLDAIFPYLRRSYERVGRVPKPKHVVPVVWRRRPDAESALPSTP